MLSLTYWPPVSFELSTRKSWHADLLRFAAYFIQTLLLLPHSSVWVAGMPESTPPETLACQYGCTISYTGLAVSSSFLRSVLSMIWYSALHCTAGLRLPSDGLETSKMFAQQQAALFKTLPIALLAVDSDNAKALLRVIMGNTHLTTCSLPTCTTCVNIRGQRAD